MAEERFQAPVNGVSIQTNDVDLWSKNAALADDRVLAELLRLAPFVSGAPTKAILPYGLNGVTSGNDAAAIVIPSGASDSTVRVRPFRAIVGSRDTIASIGHKDNWQDIRSALHIPNVSGQQYRNVQLSATVSNHRWDLIWARVDVDIDSATVSRYVKSGSGTVTAQNVVTTKICTVTIGVTEGVEGASPSIPALPSDSGSAYYIPLAAVLLGHPHTLTDAVTAGQIREHAPVISVAEAMGVTSVRAVNRASNPTGFAETIDPWTTSLRSSLYMPSTLVGGASRFFGIQGLTVGTHTLDDSVNWKNRFFKFHMNGGSGLFGPGPSDVAPVQLTTMGQSNAGSPLRVARLLPEDSVSAGAKILTAASGEQVDIIAHSGGALQAVVTGATISRNVFIWLEASGRWDNYTQPF